jgi:site-specific DNA-adenine methylase
MFSYYGSKSKIVDLYPAPKFGKIIEPFAGSARYSLKYFDRDVLLVDKYQVIIDVWHYLQQASEKDILSLPDVKDGDDIRKFNLSNPERYLIGFCINRGSNEPKNIATPFLSNGKSTQYWNKDKVRISKLVDKIRHWEIKLGSYDETHNQAATWFIDPPYQVGGHLYKVNQIEFSSLAKWCKSRDGQVIVCENTKADWLPFSPMKRLEGQRNTFTVEAIWSNLPHNYMARQERMPL